MKRLGGISTSIWAILLCLCICSSCKKDAADVTGQSPVTPQTTDNKKPKVALVMKSLANEFFSTMADGAKKHHSEHSDEYELLVNGIKDERDLARQAALIEEMVSAGAQAIVVAPADSKAWFQHCGEHKKQA